jgi:hypothetical protein
MARALFQLSNPFLTLTPTTTITTITIIITHMAYPFIRLMLTADMLYPLHYMHVCKRVCKCGWVYIRLCSLFLLWFIPLKGIRPIIKYIVKRAVAIFYTFLCCSFLLEFLTILLHFYKHILSWIWQCVCLLLYTSLLQLVLFLFIQIVKNCQLVSAINIFNFFLLSSRSLLSS